MPNNTLELTGNSRGRTLLATDCEQIVGEGLELHLPDLTRAERRERIVKMLAEVGLTDEHIPGLLADAQWRWWPAAQLGR